MQARNEDPRPYSTARMQSDDDTIRCALQILAKRLRAAGAVLDSPQAVRDFLTLSLTGLEHEEFHVLFLDARASLIAAEAMFRGTLTQTSVYPREVVKAALRHNAAAVILAHNHPSGSPEPSIADERLTACLKSALATVDVTVHDHMIVAKMCTTSFAERGLV